MLKWLRDRNAPTRVTVIESLPVDGKRRVILVSRDNTEHLVMVGGRNDLVIERNIMDPRPMQRAGLRSAICTKGPSAICTLLCLEIISPTMWRWP